MPVATLPAKAQRIRAATGEDVPHLVWMGLQMAVETGYMAHVGVNAEALTGLAMRLLSGGDDLTLLVAERDDEPVAMLGLMAYDHPMSGERIASEACWFVAPEARGGALGVRLLRAGEDWARSRGAVALQMIAPDGARRVGALYEVLGFRPVETTYMRRL